MTIELAGPGGALALHDLGGSGPPVLLVHGAGFNAAAFAPLAARLASGRHCYGLDLHGHGASQDGRPADWQGFVEDVLVALRADELGGPLEGIGHSLGGAALLGAESARPGTFARLWCFEPITTDGVASAAAHAEEMAVRARRRRSRFASLAEARAHFAGRPPFAAADPAALDGYLEGGLVELADGSVVLACEPGFEASVYEAALDFGAARRLGGVGCPVFIGYGDASGEFGEGVARVAARGVGDGHLECFPGLDHLAPFVAPGLLAEAIVRDFETAGA